MKLVRSSLWLGLIAVWLIRLLSLSAYPLMDTTEARYGEMARIMVETGNWITPQFDYGVPFWGKPPLFAWMSALGINTLGVNELAVRFPHWLLGLITVAMLAWFARRQGISGLKAAFVLSTSVIFTIASGAVMTDMALTFSLTLAMIGFYLAWHEHRHWTYVGFIGLAVGMLAKGPLVIVLMGLAILPWVVIVFGFRTGLKRLFTELPLIRGTLLMLVISVPWYVLAERATPGFLDYFIVGEHIKRFLVSGWQGDLYGTAHERLRGTIWLYALAGFMPWSLVLIYRLMNPKRSRQWWRFSAETLYYVLWGIAPMVLFTLAGNILPAYVLPGIPGLVLWLLSPPRTRKTNADEKYTAKGLSQHHASLHKKPMGERTSGNIVASNFVGHATNTDMPMRGASHSGVIVPCTYPQTSHNTSSFAHEGVKTSRVEPLSQAYQSVERHPIAATGNQRWLAMGGFIPLALIIAVVVIQLGADEKRSDKGLLNKAQHDLPVYYVGKRPFSGQFYSRGQARLVDEVTHFPDKFQIIGKPKQVSRWANQSGWRCLLNWQGKSSRGLYVCQ
ncbi:MULTISPECIES: glycosyltransferase family 39 protein [unclassified Vibrio]|uniref:ArnT family glycosyltransferase n=1 Tax=Vibrio sp. HB236076 TaxID=3232307 RepID=A0AB39HLZ1_9VIBR|nr:glycosyltransferase family 39 protein [Vibrio sp. HB161653]MDP5253157.1 glycosyltransferase family 39 protein [Vibrio sp. HB161653]